MPGSKEIVISSKGKETKKNEVALTKYGNTQDSPIEKGYFNAAFEADEPNEIDFKIGKITFTYNIDHFDDIIFHFIKNS